MDDESFDSLSLASGEDALLPAGEDPSAFSCTEFLCEICCNVESSEVAEDRAWSSPRRRGESGDSEDDSFMVDTEYIGCACLMVLLLFVCFVLSGAHQGVSSKSAGNSRPLCVSPVNPEADLNMTINEWKYNVSTAGAIPLLFRETLNASVEDILPSCVHNPYLQAVVSADVRTQQILDFPYVDELDEMSAVVPECKVPDPVGRDTFFDDPVVVITLNRTEDTAMFEDLWSKLTAYGFTNVRRFFGINGKEAFTECRSSKLGNIPLPPGALAIRSNFEAIFTSALLDNHERIIVLENDVLFSDNFDQDLARVARDPRCGSYMFNDNFGGVLLFGASEYSPKSMLFEHEIDAGNKIAGAQKCYNANMFTYGAFAVAYHRNTFVPILEFLKSEPHLGKPFDHIYGHLAIRGFIVRVMNPKVVLADVLHVSKSNAESISRQFRDKRDVGYLLLRSCLQHWPLEEFSFYRNWLDALQLDFNSTLNCTEQHIEMFKRPIRMLVVVKIEHPMDALQVVEQVNRFRAILDGRTGVSMTPSLLLLGDHEPVGGQTVRSVSPFWVNDDNLKERMELYMGSFDCDETKRCTITEAVASLLHAGGHVLVLPRSLITRVMRRYRVQFKNVFSKFFITSQPQLPQRESIEQKLLSYKAKRAMRYSWAQLNSDLATPRLVSSIRRFHYPSSLSLRTFFSSSNTKKQCTRDP